MFKNLNSSQHLETENFVQKPKFADSLEKCALIFLHGNIDKVETIFCIRTVWPPFHHIMKSTSFLDLLIPLSN